MLRIIFPYCIGMLFLLIACQSKNENLELHLTPGVTYVQCMESDMTVKETINGMVCMMHMKSQGKISCKVLSISDSSFNLEAMYESLSMQMDAPMHSLFFSSEKATPKDTFSTLLAHLKKKPFQFQLNQRGYISHIQHMDTLFSTLMNDLPSINEAQKNQILKKLTESFGKDAFQRNMEMVTAVFPNHPVSKKDRWKISSSMPNGFTGKYETNYVLCQRNDTINCITGEGISENVTSDTTIQLNGLPLKSYIKGTISSKLQLDRKSGWLRHGIITQILKGTYTVGLSNQISGGMIIPVQIENKITIQP